MKIAFINSSLGCGGAERVISIMGNYWAAEGNSITVITLDMADNDFYRLDPAIRRIALGLMRSSATPWEAIKNNLVRLMRLRDAICKAQPDVVISFQDTTNALTLLSTIGLSIPVLISERVDPRNQVVGNTWNRLRRWMYPRAQAVVVQTKSVQEWAAKLVPAQKLHVIPNPIMPVQGRNIDLEDAFDVRRPFAVAMGRLAPQKGFDLLLKAFARCMHKNWSLVILGEGSERRHLESLSRQLGVGSRVHLPGSVSAPDTVLQQAAMFVLSSRYEGFPNALLEAMSCGLPVISFDCPTGPSNIIEDGVNGVLVPPEDVNALAHAMDRLMMDETCRQNLGRRARLVTEIFSIERIMDTWKRLLLQVSSPDAKKAHT